ncbi:WD40-repeat-containing domain protein [Aspergillus granulosus]|uniref:WD40-repeat-containing domain protein n=1 Tax=Aspergillus granulosus TaxID=176169 RepID=A0ABR4I7N7_9EURO
MFSKLPAGSIAVLLKVEQQNDRRLLEDLHTISLVLDTAIYPDHPRYPPLGGFLLDNQWCTNPDLYIDKQEAHRKLLISCIRLMSTSLKGNICELNGPGTPLQSIPSGRIRSHIPPELQYACLYWGKHLQESGVKIYDDDFIHDFLKTHLLHWLEVLSLLDRVSDGIHILYVLQKHASSAKSLQDKEGHRSWVNAVAFRPDGKILASASLDTTICLWDTTTCQCLRVLIGHHASVNAIAFQPNGKTLASGSTDETIRLWDSVTGTCLKTLGGHDSWVISVAFGPDGKVLASGSVNATIYLWNLTTGTCLQTFKGHKSWIRVIAFRPDGKIMASGSGDKSIRLWDTVNRRCLHTLKGHASWVSAIRFNSDGKRLASGSDDRTIRLWDSLSGTCLRIIDGYGYNHVST